MSKSQHWQTVIEQWQASGLTQKQFCAEHQIKVATLQYWRKKFRTPERPRPEPSFLPIRPVSSPEKVELRVSGAVICLSIEQLPEVLLALQLKGVLHAAA